MTDWRDRPGWIPPWQDISTLAAHLCISDRTVDRWVQEGILPPPRLRGGKRLWKWSEVDALLDRGTDAPAEPDAERIRNATRQALETHS